MGSKRTLHRMSKGYERALKAQERYVKNLETKKRVEKLRVKTQEEEEEKEEEEERRPLALVRVIDESKIIMKAGRELKVKISNLPYILEIPSSFKQFEKAVKKFSVEELWIYLKRMREYNSFIADYSKRDKYIELFKFILTKCDNMIKDLDYSSLDSDLKYIEVYYKHIYEIASALPEIYLDYLRNKLKAYVAIIKKLDKDAEIDTQSQFPKVFQKDIFFFVRICTRIMGTSKNLKILQTVLFVVSNLIDKVLKYLLFYLCK